MHSGPGLVRRRDGDLLEACRGQGCPVFGEGRRSGDAADLAAPGYALVGRQVIIGEDVGDPETSVRPEHPVAFGEDKWPGRRTG